MANKGHSRHFKRLALAPILPVTRKGITFVKKAAAGRHKHTVSMPLLLLLRDVLHVATDSREARALLSAGDVHIDGRVVRQEDIPVGLMDIISIPRSKSTYRIVVSGGKIVPIPLDAAPTTKLCKIVGKMLIPGGRIQLALHDGRSYVIEREEDRFSVGDTLKIEIPKQKLAGFLKLERGAHCYVFAGKHAGKIATLQQVLERAGSAPADVSLKTQSGDIITRKEYVLAVDESFTLPHATK